MSFTYAGDQRLSSSWNGSFRQSGANVTVTPANWNRTIAPGASATVGLLGSYRSGNAAPTAVSC